ncbi:MAG: LamG domain-containing protein [Kiritimatiellae bacterium]|nr:LamG domain-containing protein [Kiritimatiellia bacterium]
MDLLKKRAFLKKVRGDHPQMTKAAMDVLPAADRRYIGGEVCPIVLHYCWFPDWHYINWGSPNRQLDPTARFLPDHRRAWGVSDVVGWNPISGAGDKARLYYRKQAFVVWSFENAVMAMKAGNPPKGFRFLGSAAHVIEDAASSGTSFFFHQSPVLGGQGQKPAPSIAGYSPRRLGGSLRAAAKALAQRYAAVEQASLDSVTEMRRLFKSTASRAELARRFAGLEQRQQAHASRAVADMFHTAIALAGPKPKYRAPALNENRVANPSFETDDTEGMPQGWFVVRHDLSDPLGIATRTGGYESSSEQLSHSGRRAALLRHTPRAGLEWRLAWPHKIDVRPGQSWRCRYWTALNKATGRSYAAVYLFGPDYEYVRRIEGPAEAGTREWHRQEFTFEIPQGVGIILPACCSADNIGIVAFDDIELTRIRKEAVPAAERATAESIDPDALLILRFREKEFVRDQAAHGGWGGHMASGKMLQDLSLNTKANYGIFCYSEGRWADLHARERNGRWCLALDGKDDFVEIPPCPHWDLSDDFFARDVFSVVMEVRFAARRDAVLFTKDGATAGSRAGYQLRATKDGRLRFLAGLQGQGFQTLVETAYTPRRWLTLGVCVRPDKTVELHIDGRLRDSAQLKAPLAHSDNALYLGSDNGLTDFFRGEIRRFEFYKRA